MTAEKKCVLFNCLAWHHLNCWLDRKIPTWNKQVVDSVDLVRIHILLWTESVIVEMTFAGLSVPELRVKGILKLHF